MSIPQLNIKGQAVNQMKIREQTVNLAYLKGTLFYVKKCKLTINKDAGINTVYIKRTSSPNAGAKLGLLAESEFSELYYGDVINVNRALNTGYTDSFNSYDITITNDISVDLYTTKIAEYTISIGWGSHISSLTVTRTSSKAGASIGELKTGDKVYEGDIISYNATPSGTNYYPVWTISGLSGQTVIGNVSIYVYGKYQRVT